MKQYSRFYAAVPVCKAGDTTYDDTYVHRLSAVNGVNIDDLTPIPITADGLAVWNSPLGRLFALIENTGVAASDISVASTVTVTEGDGSLAVADIAITLPAGEKALIGPFSANFNGSGATAGRFTLLATNFADLVVNFFKLI